MPPLGWGKPRGCLAHQSQIWSSGDPHPMKTSHLTSQQPAGCQRHSQPVALGGRTQGSAAAPESWPAHWSCSLEQGSVPGPAWQRKMGQYELLWPPFHRPQPFPPHPQCWSPQFHYSAMLVSPAERGIRFLQTLYHGGPVSLDCAVLSLHQPEQRCQRHISGQSGETPLCSSQQPPWLGSTQGGP